MRRMVAVCLIAWIVAQAGGLPATAPGGWDGAQPWNLPSAAGSGCSVLYATDGEQMLGGNNEDYYNPLTKVWFIPGEEGSYGRVYFGFDDYHPQGGMNEQGLFFDGLGLDTTLPVPTEGKEPYAGNLADKAMSECATVECVVGIFGQYYAVDAWRWQYLFGDATGESAIVEAQEVLRQRGGYQVATNFLQSITPPERRTCWRYQTAVDRLEGLEALSVEAMRDVLDAVHQHGPTHTLYSNVYDLVNRRVYLYHFHNYDDVVTLDLEEELAQGTHAYDLPSLFPPNAEAGAWAAPRLQQREALIASQQAPGLDLALDAYAGAYELPEGWGAPDEALHVIAGERSLWLRLPDHRQVEIFPAAADEFFHVAFLGGEFAVAYQVAFGRDGEGRVATLEIAAGDQSARMARIEPEGPEAGTPDPPTLTATADAAPASTATPTAPATEPPTMTATAVPLPTDTREPTATTRAAPTATALAGAAATPTMLAQAAPTDAAPAEATPAPPAPDKGSGIPWVWAIALLVVVGAAAGWVALRRGGRRGV